MADDQSGHGRATYSRTRVILGTIGMAIGALAPLALGAIGLWTSLRRGHVLSRGGDRMGDAWFAWYVVLILGGVGLLGYAVRFYRRHGRPGE